MKRVRIVNSMHGYERDQTVFVDTESDDEALAVGYKIDQFADCSIVTGNYPPVDFDLGRKFRYNGTVVYIVPNAKKRIVCPEKNEHGSCPHHNLFCRFPDCESA